MNLHTPERGANEPQAAYRQRQRASRIAALRSTHPWRFAADGALISEPNLGRGGAVSNVFERLFAGRRIWPTPMQLRTAKRRALRRQRGY